VLHTNLDIVTIKFITIVRENVNDTLHPSIFLVHCIACHYCMYNFDLLAVQRHTDDVSKILYAFNIILYILELLLETFKVI
jgi:hypothetical protein